MEDEQLIGKPSFCKTIKTSLFSVSIPASFVQKYGRHLKKDVTLQAVNGRTWEVGITTFRGDTKCIRRRWRRFCKDNELKAEDVVVFKLMQDSYLLVRIYDRNGSEKVPAAASNREFNGKRVMEDQQTKMRKVDLPEGLKKNPDGDMIPTKRKRSNRSISSQKFQKATIFVQSIYRTRNPRKPVEEPNRSAPMECDTRSSSSSGDSASLKEELPEYHGPKTFVSKPSKNSLASSAAQSFQSQNPCLAVVMVKSALAPNFYLHIHKKFSRKWMAEEDMEATMLDSSNKPWPVRWLARRSTISAGWRGFARHHKITTEDAIVVEVIDKMTFKCHIFRETDFEERVQDNRRSTTWKRLKKKYFIGTD